MTIHFSSDHHILHENILKLGEGRPFDSMHYMMSIIRDNWWKTVAEDDTIYLLGDIAMGDFTESIKFFQDLPGEKFFVPGNHDKNFSKNSNAHIERFTPLYEEVGFAILSENTHIMVPVSWGEQKVLLSHFPYAEDYLIGRRDKYEKNRPVNKGLPVIHGHTHSRERFSNDPLEFHVGVDANNFTPVSLDEVTVWLEGLKTAGII
jgi:calcineurin-like phosphoesterase family protein